MKKVILFISIISTHLLNAQEGLYLGLNGGYGFQAGNQTLGVNQNNSTLTAINGSFNQGLNLGLNLGYNFSKYLGADLSANYLIGSSINSSTNSGGTQRNQKFTSSFIFISPALTISPGFDRINPYAKFGPSIGIGSLNLNTTSTTGSSKSESDEKFTGGIPIGFRAAIGANYSLSENLKLNFEVFNVNMSYAPTESELIKATQNGQNILNSLSTNDKKTIYLESYDLNVNTNNNEPDKDIKTYLPMSSIGFTLGVRFYLPSSKSNSIPVE